MLDPTSLLSEDLKKQITDGLLTQLARLSERLPRASQTFLALRSDATLQKAIDDGLVRATKRFINEYTAIDEDLVAAIAQTPAFWQTPTIRAALIEMIQNPGAYLEDEKILLAQSFHDVLPDRINRERVDRAITFYLRCVAESLWHLEPFRPIYELQMQRVSVDNATQMIQAVRGMQTDFQQAILALVGTIGEQQRLLTDASTPSTPARPNVYHNLPQRDYSAFIGREAELAQILSILRPYPESQLPVISIDGIGGIGKSTLALEVAHHYLDHFATLPEPQRFQAIVWTSAKVRTLTADGIKPRRQTHRTLDDICATIAITLQREDITKTQPDRQLELVRSALTQQRTLLIVDNYETIDDDTVLNFIHELPAPTKTIITTRHRVPVAYPVRLAGMPQEDAQKLIVQSCQQRRVTLSAEQVERLFARTGGVPLAIVLSVAQIAYGLPVESVLTRLGEPQSDIVRFCFEESIALIQGRPAERLFIALSYFATTASREGLGHVADLPTLDRDDGLADLEKLSLVNKQGDRFSLLPVTKVLAAGLATQDMDQFLAYGKRWLRYLESHYTAADEYKAEYRLRYGRYLSPEDGPNLLEAVEWAYESGNAADIFSMTILTIDHLDSAGRWNLMEVYLQRAILLARTTQNHHALARLIHTLGWLFEQKGEFTEAQKCFAEALNQYRTHGDQESVGVVLQRYSALHRKLNDFATARELLEEARTIAHDLNLDFLDALLDLEEGKHYRDLHDWSASWDYFSKVRDYFENQTEETPREEGLAVGVWGHLAIVAYHLGRHQEARELCRRSIEFFAESGTKGYLATLHYRLALAEEALGETESAKRHVNEALYWFNHLGMKPDIPAALALRERLEA